MTSYKVLQAVFCICLYLEGYAAAWISESGMPDPSFKSYTVIKPRIVHGRSKRGIPYAKDENWYSPSVTVAFEALDRKYFLDLDLNRRVVWKNAVLRYQRNGSYVSDARALVDDNECYYSGTVRGSVDSSVAMSTCHGLSGLVFDGNRTLFLSPGTSGRDYLYTEDDLIQNRTCGVSGPSGDAPHVPGLGNVRARRSAELRGPRKAGAKSRYVELVLVVDQKVYQENGEDLKTTVRRTKQIANIVNSLYTPLNVFVALVGVEVWTEFDEITLSESGDTTLNSFLEYRKRRLAVDMPNDNAQLLTGVEFEGGVVGKALKGPICTLQFSGGVNMDHSKQVSLVATTVAHELGHNFGMEHDSEDCDCVDDRCIMSPSSSSVSPTHWSQCSLNYLTLAFGHGMDYCLRNQPSRLYESPVCGNGFLEPGEQCDCGLPHACDNPCCNSTECMLREGAACATGHCCDLSVCGPKKAGIKCRNAEHECDLSEYCTGDSEYCPDDHHKLDGLPCQQGESFCYAGVCRTRMDQCRILWGPTGTESVRNCYDQNTKGSRLGNCGYNPLAENFTRCQTEDVMCGMLHCGHLSERLEFGMESAAKVSATFISLGGKTMPCRTAIIDLGLQERDPGLVPNGARCGYKKMCVNQHCVPVASVTEGFCSDGCSGHGVCNSLGHCHCDRGWGPPLCAGPGDGGSIDSGPALDNTAANVFVVVLFVVFLGLVPAAAIIFCCYYIRRDNISLRKTFRLSECASSVARMLPGSGGRKKPTGGSRKMPAGAGQRRLPTGRQAAPGGLDLTAPLTQTEAGSPQEQLSSNLLGQHNGFTIRPMKTGDGDGSAVSPAAEQRRVCEVKPTVKRPPADGAPPKDAARTTFDMKSRDGKAAVARWTPADTQPPPPQDARTTFDMKPHVERVPRQPEEARATTVPAVAVLGGRTTFGMSQRPSVDRRDVPTEPVRDPPLSAARTTFISRTAGKPADGPPPPPAIPTAPLAAPVRPLSAVSPLEAVPDARSATLRSDTASKSSTLDSNRSDTLRSTGSGSEPSHDRDSPRFGSALSRMSGIFRRGDKTPGSPDPGARPGMHPNQSFKAAKIDRNLLKTMEISAPIPQSVPTPESAAPGSPQPAAPCGAAATSPPGRRAGRPASVPSRPTAPPPRPPAAPTSPAADHQLYDDCNMDVPPPRADPLHGENIYSTIEERPEEEHLYSSPPDEAADSDDLLSEINAELRSKDLYAAVNKNRTKQSPPAPPTALYQNVVAARADSEDAPECPMSTSGPSDSASMAEMASKSSTGKATGGGVSQRVRSPSPKVSGGGVSQRVRSPSPKATATATAGRATTKGAPATKPQVAPKSKAAAAAARADPRPKRTTVATRGRAAPGEPNKFTAARPPFK